VLQVLLSAGADVNALAPSGTALFSAVIATNPHSVKVLLDAGADTRLQKNTGEIALHYAQSGSTPQHEEIRRLLQAAAR
jgi:ankyrin repeat protein